MLSNVLTKTLRDRWLAVIVSASILGAFLLFGMSIYRDIDLSIYTELPQELRHLLGIGDS